MRQQENRCAPGKQKLDEVRRCEDGDVRTTMLDLRAADFLVVSGARTATAVGAEGGSAPGLVSPEEKEAFLWFSPLIVTRKTEAFHEKQLAIGK